MLQFDDTTGGNKKYKRTNSDLAKHTYKTKDRVTRTPLQTEGERRCPAPVIQKLIRTLIQDIGNTTNKHILKKTETWDCYQKQPEANLISYT
jgi:hypothetical protein